MDIVFDFVRIDNPPEGRPRTEKATIRSHPALLEDPGLRERYDIIFAYHQEAYTNLAPEQMEGLLGFVRSGGPWVGIHSASDSFKNIPEYVSMVGGKFQTHPPFGTLEIRRVAGDHFILDGIDDFTTQDEFYHLIDCRLDDKNILLVGASPGDGKTRPVAWTKRHGRGRIFYTILGHGTVSFRNESFGRLMERAVLWALGRTKACSK